MNVSDKAWHKVDISIALDTVQVVLDNCQMKNVTMLNYAQMIADRLDTDEVNSRLSLGGIPPSISLNHYYYLALNVFEYEGCLRNVRVNGELRDLTLQRSQFNLAQNVQQCDCTYLKKCDTTAIRIVRPYEFPWWIILIILAALFMLGKFPLDSFDTFVIFSIGRLFASGLFSKLREF